MASRRQILTFEQRLRGLARCGLSESADFYSTAVYAARDGDWPAVLYAARELRRVLCPAEALGLLEAAPGVPDSVGREMVRQFVAAQIGVDADWREWDADRFSALWGRAWVSREATSELREEVLTYGDRDLNLRRAYDVAYERRWWDECVWVLRLVTFCDRWLVNQLYLMHNPSAYVASYGYVTGAWGLEHERRVVFHALPRILREHSDAEVDPGFERSLRSAVPQEWLVLSQTGGAVRARRGDSSSGLGGLARNFELKPYREGRDHSMWLSVNRWLWRQQSEGSLLCMYSRARSLPVLHFDVYREVSG